ncbi:uncharacterized protein LOC114518743 [Dendronephthya gigantea]|uniref:uncharacterized protein LOC114518743 n=1 Tax=Dendronephthya gigantea TaxID=151771 RepID=UPI00106D7569|nr:uncharacterized protein LOC114518743 [Dendronephthya gigantea]
MEVKEKGEEELLSPEEFKSLNDGHVANEIKKLFQVAKKKPEAISQKDFSRMRDYVILHVTMGSGQRYGAIANLSVKDFKQAERISGDGEDELYRTKTIRHKTGSIGPAKLFWHKDVKEMAEIYLKGLRPVYANEQSVVAAKPGVEPEQAMFITINGKAMNESVISTAITRLGKSMNDQIQGNLIQSRLRKSIISTHRKVGSTISKELMASQMTHSVKTADQYYDVRNTDRVDSEMAEFLRQITSGGENQSKESSSCPAAECSEEPKTSMVKYTDNSD